MKINVISDLHIDFADLTLPGGDVLILSGDICEARHLKKEMYNPDAVLLNHERQDQRPDRYYRFFEEECSKYRETVMVMGNHEHYGFHYHKTYLHLQQNLPDHVTLLENQTHTIDDVVFVGCSLWTDMNRGDPLTEWHCGRSMNDYRSITMFNQAKSAYHRLTVERTVADHHASRQFIADTVEADASKKYVVVTHHAPSFASVAEQYRSDTLMNGAYASDLTDFILDHPQIKLWTHGHMHNVNDYVIGSTRVVCNPRGYNGYESRADLFQADAAVIEI
jgi:Icc-related predicted phosphoesterase